MNAAFSPDSASIGHSRGIESREGNTMTMKTLGAAALAIVLGVTSMPAMSQEIDLDAQMELLRKRERGEIVDELPEGGSPGVVSPLPEDVDPQPQVIEPEVRIPDPDPVPPAPEPEVENAAPAPAPGPELSGPSAVQIERQLDAQPRIRLRDTDRVTVREFKRRPDLRRAAPSIDIQAINFAFGSDEIPRSQFRKVENIAIAMERILDRDPDTLVLIEGHTDAVGSAGSNQILSERRAASLKRVLVREFGIPRSALETVGYGEDYLLVPTSQEEWRNRRVTLRAIDSFISTR